MSPEAALTGPAARERAARRRARARAGAALEDRYLLESGRTFMPGIAALARLPIDQHRADARAGLRTATMISGYQGSPLGGFDRELARIASLRAEHDVEHVPAVNEELGATAVWGSQLAAGTPGARFDGVVGVWYGKAPGLDRAADAIRHGNAVGTTARGGVVALVGDDPAAKSSTLPSASESLLAALGVPVLYPGGVQELLDLGRHAVALSRASGLWVALKVVTAVADATATVTLAPDRVRPRMPAGAGGGAPYEHVPDARLLPPFSSELERSLHGPRREAALAYARENELGSVRGSARAWLGIVAAGKPRRDVEQALDDLGLRGAALERAGIRVLDPGLIWPLEPDGLRRFARGLSELLVVEEKAAFLEPQVRDVLYGTPGAPRVTGRRDESGAELLPATGELDADRVARAVAARLAAGGVRIESVEARLRAIGAAGRGAPRALALAPGASDAGAARTPFFCSGCPHNSSLAAPDGTLVGAGIGCHTMVLLSPEGHGEVTGVTQMGGEGAQWIGIAPFTERGHFVQNLGDGTFHHSGSLAVRAAVAAGVNVTFKLLANGTVAMTGGQDVVGGMDVPALTRALELEGVVRTVVTSEDPGRLRGAALAANAQLRPRADLLEVQRELAAVEGVTAIVHDQACAAELRRARRRGDAPMPAERIMINERVCEGCGDCGRKSSCLSVQPVDTPFGRRTRIHQSSCNLDRSCLDGDCPSFLTVVPAAGRRESVPPPPESPPPARAGGDQTLVRMAGIGGTGVVTVSQVLGMAALLDGLHVAGLDQTGLSQKGGPVVSDVRIARRPIAGGARPSAGRCDVLLALDALAASAPATLAACSPERTAAVVSTSEVPTGRAVTDPDHVATPALATCAEIERRCRAGAGMRLDANHISERIFGDHMQANVVALGAALQLGVLPVSAGALEAALRLNGAAVERNLAALGWGRAAVANPAAVREAVADPQPAAPELGPELRALAEAAAGRDRGALREAVSLRLPELRAHSGIRACERYAELVAMARDAEAEVAPGRTELAEAVAAGLYAVMAPKDEYEVARLLLLQSERARVEAAFGPGAKVRWHLHPPLLRALGLRRKLAFGPWFSPVLRLLRAGRRLRGTALDPFGHTRVRRTERELAVEYEDHVRAAIAAFTPAKHAEAVALCESVGLVRGYEEIKLRSVERFRERAGELRAALEGDAYRSESRQRRTIERRSPATRTASR